MQESSHLKKIVLKNGDTVILLGTAHVSRQSVRDVEEAAETFNPDTFCIEVDEGRLESLKNPDDWRKLNVTSILKRRQGFLLLANLALAGYQKKAGQAAQARPGQEMLEAAQLAEQRHAALALCDRPVALTLRRAWAKSSLWGKAKLLAGLLGGMFEEHKEDAEAIEKLKESDALSVMMNEFGKELPAVKEVLIDERDAYLAAKIYAAAGRKRLAVLGAGHLAGVAAWLERLDQGQQADIKALEEIPKPSFFMRVLPLLIPIAVVVLVTAGFVFWGRERGSQMALVWFLANGIPAALGAAAALGHPLSILVSFLAAPFTSLNPTVGVGMVSGLVEAFMRKPRALDFEDMGADMQSLRGWYKNRILRTLLVLLFSSLGSSIGTFVGAARLFSFAASS